jgi:Flp pilus assembly protein TadD
MSTPRRANLIMVSLAGSLLLGGCASSPLAIAPDGGVVTASTSGGRGGSLGTVAPVAAEAGGAATPKARSGRGADRLALARSLRDKGDRAKALVELERGRAEAPGNRQLAREAGLIALELGQTDKARKHLEAAIDPGRPDGPTLSALGTALAAAGKQTEAQAHFKRALALQPNHRPTLNNLALSYALDGKLADAEKTLRAAGVGEADTPRQMKENLALVMALAGKYDDAERLATKVLPKAQAKSNIVYVRSMTQQGG